ncbi:hypothetical protein ACFV9C_11590 [Kribbella sp. NPDC059898]|uniref:hypothetical protein n=1 Tax=Kribbella sp. NPDC059898 TaxID=3346995 RepID=UPI00364C9A84
MDQVVPALTIRDLTSYGTTTDITYLAEAIHRAQLGEIDYLAVCPPSDVPVAVRGTEDFGGSNWVSMTTTRGRGGCTSASATR